VIIALGGDAIESKRIPAGVAGDISIAHGASFG
jgi:hypothetical protein